MDYLGDVALAFLGGQLVQDEFWHGAPWMIGLNRHREAMRGEAMSFYFRPMYKGHECLQDLPEEIRPDFSKGDRLLEIRGAEIVPQYQVEL